MDADQLYWETGVPHRRPYRKYFHGWQAANTNAMWWAQAGREVYIGVYGFTELSEDGNDRGYERNILPNYETAVMDKIFLDFDYHDPSVPEERFKEAVTNVKEWLTAEDIRRRWIFSGGGIHCLIRARGERCQLDNAILHIISNVAKSEMVDPAAFDIERMRRFPTSYNKKRHAWCINIKESEAVLSFNDIWKLAQSNRSGSYPEGSGTYYFDTAKPTKIKKESLGKYMKRIAPKQLSDILEDYGIDWDEDICPAMQKIITGTEPSNFERMQLLKYLRSIVGIPFVDPENDQKTVMNLVYNMLNNKQKAIHSIKTAEAESVYKRARVFHPYKLRSLGYCPRECNKCLEERKDV